MNKYDIIYESLQNQLDNGMITMELAEEVNDLAYEKYVVEANAYDKWRKNKEKEYNKTLNRIEAYRSLNNPNANKKIADEGVKEHELQKAIKNYKPHADDSEIIARNDKTQGMSKEYTANKLRAYNNIHSQSKRDWMSRHGNDGESPEKRYKANRYLEAQKKLRENK